MSALILKAGREKSLLRRHPWIFSGAIQHVDNEPLLGGTVDLLSSNKQFLARASYSPTSQIRVRVWTFEDEPVDKEFFRKRIRKAIDTRYSLSDSRDTDSFRLIYAESDGVPGLIVDRYSDVLVLQSLTAGSEFWKETLADLLLEETGFSTIYERSDADVRELEGLEPKVGLLRGVLPNSRITIHESGLKLNGFPIEKTNLLEGDVFQLLRKFRDENRSLDMIILDPPKFAPTAAQAARAARGYKDINLLAFKLLRAGGMLVTFSCSGGVDAGLFQKIVAGAALDASVEVQIIEHLAQGPDHPVSLHFPEGAYLKGLICYKPG